MVDFEVHPENRIMGCHGNNAFSHRQSKLLDIFYIRGVLMNNLAPMRNCLFLGGGGSCRSN